MRRSTLFAGVAAAALLFMPLAAQAQATSEGAESIRLGIKDWIATKASATGGSTQLSLSGPIAVAPEGDHYNLTLPASELTIDPDQDGGGGTIALGEITAVLKPTPQGWYEATWTLPGQFLITENDGDDVVTVTIGKQAGQGVYAPEFEGFLSADLALEAIDISSTKGNAVTIASVAVKSESTETSSGIYDASGFFELSGLKVTEAGVEIGGLDKLTLDAKASDANLAEITTFQTAIEALETKYDVDGEDLPAGFFEEFSALLASLPVLFTAVDAKYTLEGLSIDSPDGKVNVASTSFGFDLTGLDAGAATFALEIGLADLGIEPPPPYAEYIPSDIAVDIALQGIPNAGLMAALNGFVQSATTLGVDAAGQMAAGQLAQALLTSDSSFEITTISAKTPTLSFDMTGSIKPNANSPFGVAGTATMLIGGLDQAIAAAQGMPDGPQAIQMLTMIQTLGAQETDAAGNPVRKYDVVIGENGDLLLNGTDLKPLLGGL